MPNTRAACLNATRSYHLLHLLNKLTQFIGLVAMSILLFYPNRTALAVEFPLENMQKIAWSQASESEIFVIDDMYSSKYWHIRIFALMRLIRFEGEEAVQRFTKGFSDPDWHVRTFSLLYAHQMGVKPILNATEEDPFVLRAAMAVGITVPSETLTRVAQKISRERNFERQLFALELMLLADDERSVQRAGKVLGTIIPRMEDTDTRLYGWRIMRLLGADAAEIERGINTADQLRSWVQNKSRNGSLLSQDKMLAAYPRPSKRPHVASIDDDELDYVYTYVDQLAQNELELAVLIDATGSMGSEIHACQLQVDRIISVLGHLSKKMRVALSLTETMAIVKKWKLPP